MSPPRISKSECCRTRMAVFFILATVFGFCAPAGASEAAVATAQAPILSASEIDYPPFCIVDASGRTTGFSVELLRAALAAMGRNVAFRTGPWSQVRDWLEKGEVQALPLVGRTPEREHLFDFTFPYMSLHGAIVVREDVSDIRDLSDLKGRRVAVMKGDNAEEFLRREDRGIEIHTTATFEEALQELSKGRYDAVVIQRLVALRLIQETGLTNLRIVNRPIEGFRQDFCFAVKEGDRDTLALLNEGLALVIADGTYRHLHAKWFAALELPTHRRIIVGGDHNYPPYEFLDEKGRPSGFNVELTRAIAQETGLDIEIRLGPWAEIVQKLEKGEIDAVQGMFYSPERDLKFDFTPPHTVNHCVSVVRKGEGPAPATIEALNGKRIVVQQGDIMHDFVLENGLQEQVVAVDSQGDALRELAEGKHDCALVSRMTAMYWIEKYVLNNLAAGRRPFLSPEYGYAVPNGHKALLAQFSEGLKVLEKTGEYRRIYKKWLGVYGDESSDLAVLLRYAAMAAVPLLLILLAFLLWSWSLRKQVASRTEELHESERLLAAIIDAIAAPVFYKNAQGVYLGCNRAYTEFMGLPKESIIGKTAFDVAPVDLAEIYHGADLALMKTGNVQVYETEIVDHSGARRQVIFHKALFRGPDGAVKGIVGAMLDITERKLSEEALKQRNDFIRTVLDNLPVGLAVNSIEEKTPTYMNKQFEEIYGWPAEELKDVDTFFEKVYPDPAYRQKIRKQIIADIESGDPVRMQWDDIEVAGKDGRKRMVSAKNIPLFEQNIMISTVQDVTTQNQTLAALRESEEIFSKFMEHSPIYMFFKDDQLRALRLSANYESMLGRPMNELLGKSTEELFPSDLARSMVEDDKRILQEGKPVEVEEELDGRHYYTIKFPIHSGNKPQYLAGFTMDITARKRAEEAREKLQSQLIQAQKMESVGRLAGGVAHDFNNMLSVILGYTEMALGKTNPEDPLHADLLEVLNAAKRSAEIIRQLLAFARKQIIAPRALDLNETVEGMLKMLRRLIGENIDLSWHPGAGLSPVEMDSSQLDQILANLCVNARDAIADVGKITIETENVEFDEAYCADHAGFLPGLYVRLAVSDDGCGMDKETLDNLFEPFFTTKDVGKGTGLGLATVYGIVKQNNGFINVYSEPGRGTTFKIYLPRLKASAEQVSRKDPVEPDARGNETILLVEDERSILKMTTMMLERLGYIVLTASTPGEAIDLAREHAGEIHLLMTDVVMPEMNGRELAERLQALYPDLKILFMSGYTANVIAHRGVLDEGTHFIPKPFSLKELAAKVREALNLELDRS